MVRAAMRACRQGFGAPAARLPMGGSVAAVPVFQDTLGIPSVLVGFGLPDDGKHGPNERFHLPTFRDAVATSIHFLAEVA
jgi:acetylornithine deacetylase/succinyl-diaminopimelate desuccinylase-like protein